MAQFYALRVSNIQKTTRDAVVVSLKPENGADFSFVQGQYLTFRRDFDGEELRRSYSICSGQDDGILQVGIKRVDGGVFSSWANTELAVGDLVEAMLPRGKFYAKAERPDAHYLAFAGGSGITPVLSVLKTGLASELTAKFTLVYANRNLNTIMFREEIEDLKNLYMSRLSVIHILEDENQHIDLFKGRVDGVKCAQLFEDWIDVESVDIAYVCGPEPMMLAITEALKTHGLGKDQIRFELFATGQPGRAKKRAESHAANEIGIPGRIILGGETRSVQIQDDMSLLETALDNKIDAPYACCAGVCSTCKAKLIEGEVEMKSNHALEDYEVEAGYVLTCQSYPISNRIIWDYDQAGH